MNIDELRKLLKYKGVHFFSYWGKQKLMELAEINDLLPKEEEPKEETQKRANYERLKTIRLTPTKVILKEVETEKEHTFPSIYKAVLQSAQDTVLIAKCRIRDKLQLILNPVFRPLRSRRCKAGRYTLQMSILESF